MSLTSAGSQHNSSGVLLRHFDRDGFHFGVCLQPILSQLPATPRHLVAAEWGLGPKHIIAVDPHSASLEGLGQIIGLVQVLGEDSCSQPIFGIVGSPNDFLYIQVIRK